MAKLFNDSKVALNIDDIYDTYCTVQYIPYQHARNVVVGRGNSHEPKRPSAVLVC